ncbi:MAG TPA: hypothetical protein VLK82_12755 [Candidatus Tectomicrobia bacterium]|nr:hypothetical protein [Candidatus Tectomicrobia bacterium]
MRYDELSLKEITEKYQDTGRIHDQLMLRLVSLLSKLTNDKAKEYLMQGAGRRLNIITRCIENIFHIFPIGQTKQLTRDELTDVGINLHAFFVNISGLFDNLGWVFAFEYDLLGDPKDGKLGRKDIGLFNRKTQIRLSNGLRKYLQSDRLRVWYSEYSKNYRDALAHRIPLYVPPSVLSGADQEKYLQLEAQLQTLDLTKYENFEIYDYILKQQKQLGQASPYFTHSVGKEGRPMFLHAQVLADYATIEEVVKRFCEHFEPKAL